MMDKMCLEYAKAYIVLQKYDNLYNLNEALRRGTAFADLYRPYRPSKIDRKDNDCKDYYKC